MERQEVLGAAPTAEVIEAYALGVIARLPAAFRQHLRDVVLLVEEEADAEMLASVGLDHPLDLTGVYVGRPVGEKSSLDSGALPDRIHLYRQAILAEWCESGVRLDDLVAHVTVHEIGHHFGLSDDDMHALEDAVAD
ncbi:metallopeptidase family protein [uncultured Sphingomonas sp.]|uniref:metallopeptidase family protein n=1 Tax=uncultured Sphingomonas sp. TaxID=158754 RepID=UPI00261E4EA1|nr:metallopeptidase family protein [uncultured Sphingomonas sp.]